MFGGGLAMSSQLVYQDVANNMKQHLTRSGMRDAMSGTLLQGPFASSTVSLGRTEPLA